jgi:hypothetical protein
VKPLSEIVHVIYRTFAADCKGGDYKEAVDESSWPTSQTTKATIMRHHSPPRVTQSPSANLATKPSNSSSNSGLPSSSPSSSSSSSTNAPPPPAVQIERIEKLCSQLPDEILRQTLLASHLLFTNADTEKKDRESLIRGVAKESLAVGTAHLVNQLTNPTIEAWASELKISTSATSTNSETKSPQAQQQKLSEEKLKEKVNAVVRDDPRKHLASMSTGTLRWVCAELRIEYSELTEDDVLKTALGDEIVLLGWEGVLQAQAVPVLKQMHERLGLALDGSEEKVQLVERLVVHAFDLTQFFEEQQGKVATEVEDGQRRLVNEKMDLEAKQTSKSPGKGPAVDGVESSRASGTRDNGSNHQQQPQDARKEAENENDLSRSESESESDGTGRGTKRTRARAGSADEVRPGMTEAELLRLRSVDLKAYCRRQSLPVSGTKQQMANQILTFWQAGGARVAPGPAPSGM